MRTTRLCLACLSVLVPTAARAEVDAGALLKARGSQSMTSYVGGLGSGIVWANARLDYTGKPPLFCIPDGTRADPPFFLALIERAVRKTPELADKPAGLILVDALVDAYPCRR